VSFVLGLRRRRAVVVAVVAMLSAVPVTAVAQPGQEASNPYGGSWQPYPAEYGASDPVAVTIPLPDGVTVAGEAVYPTDPATGERAGGTFPVLLELSPYGKTPPSAFTPYGYIAVGVTERGTWESGGERQVLFGRERGTDGAAIVRWLASELPQTNGRVGMTGCSNPGYSQLVTAQEIGPNSPLLAISPRSAPQLNGSQDFLRESILVNGVPGETSVLIGTALFAMEGASRPVGQYQQWQASWQTGGDWSYDRATSFSGTAPYPAADIVANGIPALLWSGTQDIVPNWTMSMYVAMQNAYRSRDWRLPMAPSQRPTPRYQVVVNNRSHCEEHDLTLLLRWFDTWVKGERTGIEDTRTPIHFLEQPTGRWVNASNYPFTNDYRSFHLAPQGILSGDDGGAGAAPLMFGPPEGPQGTAAFTTPQFHTATNVAGVSSATVYASTSSINLHLVATLQDVSPDGTVTKIAHGNVVGSLGRETTTGPEARQVWRDRDGTVIKPFYDMHEDSYLTPNEVYRFDIRIGTVMWTVQPGHSLRLQLSTQVPAGDCVGLLGSDPCFFTTPQLQTLPGTYTVHFGGANPSRLNLPLVDPASFATAAAGITPTSGAYVQPLDWG
jgi:predicted acyl esterase